MMIDYNVRDDWPANEPRWMKSLVSSLDRRHRSRELLALPVIVQEIVDWVALASGEEAWKMTANRESLKGDLEQSIASLGSKTKSLLDAAIARFAGALAVLSGSTNAVRTQAPGTRTAVAWTDVTTAGETLLSELASDAALGASWSDLVEAAQVTNPDRLEHHAIVNLMSEQLQLRRHEPQEVFNHVIRMLAYGSSPKYYGTEVDPPSAEDRLASAQKILLALPTEQDVVVWLGYRGGSIDFSVQAGQVTFLQAAWSVPNTKPGRQDFAHKDELARIVDAGMFRVAELVTESSEVDMLARVDLGRTTLAGAAVRAESVVNALLNISIHRSGGVRPVLSQTVVMSGGEVGGQSWTHGGTTEVDDDYYGRNITAKAIETFAPKLGVALASNPLPMYLAAAVEAQTAADMPHSRERMMQRPGEADMRAAVPLEDRVVQHVAAHASITPIRLFKLLLRHWASARWTSDIDQAVRICLLGSGPKREKVEELQRKLYASRPASPWLVFVADNEATLLDLCRVESEKAWVKRMLRSVSDPTVYADLIGEYEEQKDVLAARRTRTRNALVHGNPVSFQVVESVNLLASFLSREALRVGLDSFVTGVSVPAILENEEQAHLLPLLNGTSVADYWRAWAAAVRIGD